MKKNRILKKGYVAIETVIVGALILSIGFFAMLSFTDVSTKATERLTRVLGFDNPSDNAGIEYDSNGYAISLGINPADINLVSDFAYEDLGSSYRITSYLNLGDTDVIIPKFHTDGKPITEIGSWSLKMLGLTSVVFPNSITTIGEMSFSDNSLTTVIIPDSVTDLKGNAFAYNLLTEAYISKNITVIENGVFNDNHLVTIIIPEGVTDINGAFVKNDLTSVSFPASLKSISNGAFAYNKISGITINEGLITIGSQAFQDNLLETITIPSTVTTIGECAFSGNLLSLVAIPSSVESLGEQAFKNNQLTSVIFLGNAPSIPAILYWEPEPGVFSSNQNLTTNSIKVPAGQLSAYQALASAFGVEQDAFYE